MKPLSKHWFTSAPIDFEHKQYVLLDFIQSIREDFASDVLYPWLSEVQKQHADLTAFQHDRKEILERFKKIKRFDFERMEFEYEYDLDYMDKDFREITSIIEFSIPKFDHWLLKGQHLFDVVKSQMTWKTIGIVPEYKDEGYFILHINEQDLLIYRFKLEKIILENENYFGITTEEIDRFRSRLQGYEDIKIDLMKRYDLPCPYTISIQTKSYPLKETLMPIVKRMGLQMIKNGF